MDSIQLYKNKSINKEQLLLFYIIKDNNSISMQDLIQNFDDIVSIDNLNILESFGLINIDYNKNIIEIKRNKLSSSDIDKIRVILNREIRTFELEKIKQWFLTYELEEITDAIYQTMIKGIDNFNYVEKVLFNDKNSELDKEKTSNLTGKKVIKKFDLFD